MQFADRVNLVFHNATQRRIFNSICNARLDMGYHPEMLVAASVAGALLMEGWNNRSSIEKYAMLLHLVNLTVRELIEERTEIIEETGNDDSPLVRKINDHINELSRYIPIDNDDLNGAAAAAGGKSKKSFRSHKHKRNKKQKTRKHRKLRKY